MAEKKIWRKNAGARAPSLRALLYNPRIMLPAMSSAASVAPQPLKRHILLRYIIFSAPILALATGLVLGNLYWHVSKEGSLGRLTVAGVEVRRSSPDQDIGQKLSQKLESYAVRVSKPGSQPVSYDLGQIGISADIPATIAEAKAAKRQGSWFRRLSWWRKDSSPLRYAVDEEKFQIFTDEQTTVFTEPPVNAGLVIENGQTRTTAAQDGKGYTALGGREKILAATSHLTPLDLDLEVRTLPPKISDEAAAELKTRVDKLLAQPVQVRINNKVFNAGRADIAELIDLPDFKVAKSAEIEVNSGRVLAYLDQIAKPYVQQTRSEVVMKDAEGNSIVLVKGRDGSDIVGKKEVATSIAKKMAESKGIDEELRIDYARYETVNAATYDKWLVVDLTDKKMYAYEGSNLVRSFLVSAGAPSTPTVLGQYKIYAKNRRQDMRGLNTDGSSYFQADVEWTNYFYNDYAIHGNYWRPNSWFGNVNSSHGCVGIINSDAQWVYEWAPVGTPVITHL